MKRDLIKLSQEIYDVVVIGGGIYGACVAWEASRGGLSVALLEKSDFGQATSFNSQKIIHGGLRYLQHADFKRMRESIRERRRLMQIAPHLINLLPCIMPTYGHLLQGKEIMRIALMINDLIGLDRNDYIDPQSYISRGRIVSRAECLKLFPGLREAGLNGGALWYDCQAYNSERLLLSFLHSAVQRGAELANYMEVTGFIWEGGRIAGVEARDVLGGDHFQVRGKIVVNTSGPWINQVLSLLGRPHKTPQMRFVKVMVLLTRPIVGDYALGVWSGQKYLDDDAIINKGSRLFFITPWHKYNLVGTTEQPYDGSVDHCKATEGEIQDLINQVNRAYPGAHLGGEDVLFFYTGLLPRSDKHQDVGEVQIAKHYRLIDHYAVDGIEGLLSVIGVKLTTVTDVARKAVDMVFRKLGKVPSPDLNSATPLWGSRAEVGWFKDYLATILRKRPSALGEEVVRHLVHNYGTEDERVMRYAEENPAWLTRVTKGSPVIWAEIVHAIRDEMAQKLSDVILRRTEVGEGGYPGDKCLAACAEMMAKEKGWDRLKTEKEIDEVKAIYKPAQ